MQPRPHDDEQRDPVASFVEHALRDLAQVHAIEFQVDREMDRPVELRFGEHTASGETHDIAILRLAANLLDDCGYGPQLLRSFRHSREALNSFSLNNESEAGAV